MIRPSHSVRGRVQLPERRRQQQLSEQPGELLALLGIEGVE